MPTGVSGGSSRPCLWLIYCLRSPEQSYMSLESDEITVLLKRWQEGDSTAFDSLVPLVYPRLRQIASAQTRRERSPAAMQPTVLVHELYLKLLGQKRSGWNDREHFYAVSAKVMRLILIDDARQVLAQRRGGQVEHIPLSDDLPWVGLGSPEMIDLDNSLGILAQKEPPLVALLELHFFLGCNIKESADILGISESTVKRNLKFAKTWLYRRMVVSEETGPQKT